MSDAPGDASREARPGGEQAPLAPAAPAGELGWEGDDGPHPHEARYLKLDSSKARAYLDWRPRWDLEEALARIVEWYAALRDGGDMRAVTLAQIEAA